MGDVVSGVDGATMPTQVCGQPLSDISELGLVGPAVGGAGRSYAEHPGVLDSTEIGSTETLYGSVATFAGSLGSDETPPYIDNVEPVDGSTIGNSDPIEFDVLDGMTGVAFAQVSVRYPDNSTAVIHNGTVVAHGFQAGTTRSEVEGGFHFVIAHDGGWTKHPTLRITAVDAAGNVLVSELSWTISDPVETVVDTTAPTVTDIDPAPGTTITASTQVSLKVLDNVGLRRVWLAVQLPGGLYDVVHDGDRFAPLYSRGAERTQVAGGYQYTGILRAGGWPGVPRFKATAVDTSGNEAS